MRKVRLNSGFNYMQTRNLAEEATFLGNCAEAIRMFVAQPGPDVVDAVKQTLVEAQKSVDRLNKYANSASVNSARLPVGGEQNDVDAEFLDEASSIIGLEDGQSIDLSKAQLLYNEDTMELMLTDEDEVPDGYDVVGVVEETPASDDSNEDEDDDGEAKEPEDAESADKETTDDASAEEQPAAPKAESESPAEESEEF